VQAGFSIELGSDDEALEFPWSADNGPRYYDLKRQPGLLVHIEEATRFPELKEFLTAVNASTSMVETAKCDAWFSDQINPEEEIFGAPCKFGSYVDLVLSDEPSRYSFPEHEKLARRLTELLKHVPEIPASTEFLVRRCYYHESSGEETREGFYITFYLFGYGDDGRQARQRWGIALKLVENAVRQISGNNQNT